MDIFSVIETFLADLPFWCLYVPPAAALLSAIPFFLCRKRGGYLWVSALCYAAGMLLSLNAEHGAMYRILFAALVALPLPLFAVPKGETHRETREEKLYRKFEPEMTQPVKKEREYPPKVCCFEEQRGETPEERGMKLSHVITLLEKLKREKLTPADRLEVEMLSRNVTGAEGRTLTDGQTDDLSDSLSAVLRLMAKYSA